MKWRVLFLSLLIDGGVHHGHAATEAEQCEFDEQGASLKRPLPSMVQLFAETKAQVELDAKVAEGQAAPGGGTAEMPSVSHVRGADGSIVSRILGVALLGDPLELTHAGQAWGSSYVVDPSAKKSDGWIETGLGASNATGSNATGESGASSGSGQGVFRSPPRTYQGLLFFFGCLAVGTVLLALLERHASPVPYRGLVYLLGCGLPMVHCTPGDLCRYEWVAWGNALELWEAADAHTIYFGFLPALLLGRVLRIRSNLLWQTLPQILVLAGACVIIGSTVLAEVSMHLLPCGWSFHIALIFGAVLFATNSSAIAAFFDWLGASPRLVTVLSGEGVFGECIAAVIVTLMLKLQLGGEATPQPVLLFMVSTTVPAIAVGFVLSSCAARFIRFASNTHCASESIIEVALVVCCGYLSFIIAEAVFSSSGVIATVTAGIHMASTSWTHDRSQEKARDIWRIFDFIGETLVFFLAGAICADGLRNDSPSAVGWAELFYVPCIWLCILGTRVTVVLIMWPLIAKAGAPLTGQEGVVLMFCGAPSTVGITLVLVVAAHPGVPKPFCDKMLFLVGSVSALSVFAGSVFGKPLLRGLGLTRSPATTEAVISQVSKHLGQLATRQMELQTKDTTDIRFRGALHTLIVAMAPSLRGTQAPGGFGLSSKGFVGPVVDSTRLQAKRRDLHEIYREVFLRYVIHHYKQAYQENVIPQDLDVLDVLVDAAETALLDSTDVLSDWDIIANGDDPRQGKASDVSTLANQKIAMRYVFVSLAFQEAHQRARAEIAELFATEDPAVQRQVNQESFDQTAKASAFLTLLPSGVVEAGRCEMVSRKLLRLQAERLHYMCNRGILAPCEATHLRRQVRSLENRLVEAPLTKWLGEIACGPEATAGPPVVDSRRPPAMTHYDRRYRPSEAVMPRPAPWDGRQPHTVT